MRKVIIILAAFLVLGAAAGVILPGVLANNTKADVMKEREEEGISELMETKNVELAGTIVKFSDMEIADCIERMAEASDVIVLGSFDGSYSVWNMSRDTSDPAKESAENYVEGRLYGFDVSEVIKGNASADRILVNYRCSESMLFESSDAVVNEEGVITGKASESRSFAFMAKDQLFIEPKQHDTYMLFLKFDPTFNDYYAAIHPFAVRFAEGRAELESNLIGLEGGLSETVEVEGLGYVKAVTQICGIEDHVSGLSIEEVLQKVSNSAD